MVLGEELHSQTVVDRIAAQRLLMKIALVAFKQSVQQLKERKSGLVKYESQLTVLYKPQMNRWRT